MYTYWAADEYPFVRLCAHPFKIRREPLATPISKVGGREENERYIRVMNS